MKVLLKLAEPRAMLLLRGSVMAIAGLIVVILLEVSVVGWHRSTLRKLLRPSASLRRDIISYFLEITGVLTIFGTVFSLGLALYFGQMVRKYLGLDLLHSVPSIVLQNTCFIFVSGFSDYWMHRFSHRFLWLWEIHKFHHSATELSVFTARRNSVLSFPISMFFGVIPFAVLGTPSLFPWFAAFISAHAMLIHSEIDWDFGWFGRWILISPHDHRVHHSTDPKHQNKNFGFFLPFWDQVFGTFYSPRDQVTQLGVEDDFYNEQPYVRGMIANTRLAFRSLFRG